MAYLIELRDITKIYRMGKERIVALRDVCAEIRQRDVVMIMGKSGSGKSTLLNLLAGIEKPSRGLVKVKGRLINQLTEKQLARFRQRFLGFVFQSYNLLPHLTALENVEMPLVFRGLPRSVRRKRATAMLEQVGLGDRINHKPGEMSGGQQQRVSIARAFVGKPELVLADEPTGNLDSATTHEVIELMTTMAREQGQTLIIVTHDSELSSYADMVIELHDGMVRSVNIVPKSQASS